MSAPAKGSEGSRLARQPPAPWASQFLPHAGRARPACSVSVSRQFGARGGSHTLQGPPPAGTAADPLQPRGDLGVIPVGMIAAPAADQLERAGAAAFHPAVHDAGRLAPQVRGPAVAGLASKREPVPASASRRSHGSRAMARSARYMDGTRT